MCVFVVCVCVCVFAYFCILSFASQCIHWLPYHFCTIVIIPYMSPCAHKVKGSAASGENSIELPEHLNYSDDEGEKGSMQETLEKKSRS